MMNEVSEAKLLAKAEEAERMRLAKQAEEARISDLVVRIETRQSAP